MTAYLGLGSNLPDRAEHLRYAVVRLREKAAVTGISSVYESEPVGCLEQPAFLNMVVRIDAGPEPEALLHLALQIERERGRVRSVPNAPRTLDLDLLLYDGETVNRPELTVPHPRMTERAFVLVPLLELAPSLMEPETGRSYASYLAALRDTVRSSGGASHGDEGSGDLGIRRLMAGRELLDEG